MNLDIIMSLFSGKKIFLLGFIVVLLIAIPLTVYLAQQQQKTKSGAAPSTTLSFTPVNQSTTVDQTISFDIMVNPGSNQVSFVKFTIVYDGTKLSTAEAGLVPNTATGLPNVAGGPTYESNTVTITLNVGSSPQNSLTLPTKLGTISFKAIAPTQGTPTEITFRDSQAMSVGGESSFSENVLSSTGRATVTIEGAAPATNKVPTCSELKADNLTGNAPLTVKFTGSGTDSDGTISKMTFNFGDGQGVTPNTDSSQNSGTGSDQTGYGTASVTGNATHTYNTAGTFTANLVFTDDDNEANSTTSCTQTITVTAAPQANNVVPACSSLSIDNASGSAPLTVNFTAAGTDSDGTISKATFNYGDGAVEDVSQGGGFGTNSVSIQQPHTFNTAGTFTANVVFTDDSSGVSTPSSCSQTIAVSAGVGPTAIPTAAAPTAIPTALPPTGPGEQLVAIGAFGAILSIIGAVLLLAL